MTITSTKSGAGKPTPKARESFVRMMKRTRKGKRIMHQETTSDGAKEEHVPKAQKEAKEAKQFYRDHFQT
jgi:hypothetical protein